MKTAVCFVLTGRCASAKYCNRYLYMNFMNIGGM